MYSLIIGLDWCVWLLVSAFVDWIGYGLDVLMLEWLYVYINSSMLRSIGISIAMIGMVHLWRWSLCDIIMKNDLVSITLWIVKSVASSALLYELWCYHVITCICDQCEGLCGICVWIKWNHVFSYLMIGDHARLGWCL